MNKLLPTTHEQKASLYQFGLALFCVYLVMKFLPRGQTIGFIALGLAAIVTPSATDGAVALLAWLQNPSIGTAGQPGAPASVNNQSTKGVDTTS